MPRRPQRAGVGELEVHSHCYITGPHANGAAYKFEHAHADGGVPHAHPDTGPAAYTIDKDEWYAATGLHGGGRKRYSQKPTGPQMPYVPRTPAQQTFRVVFCDTDYTAEHAHSGVERVHYEGAQRDARAAASPHGPGAMRPGVPGYGGAAVANMALSFGMTPIYEYDDCRPTAGHQPPLLPDEE